MRAGVSYSRGKWGNKSCHCFIYVSFNYSRHSLHSSSLVPVCFLHFSSKAYPFFSRDFDICLIHHDLCHIFPCKLHILCQAERIGGNPKGEALRKPTRMHLRWQETWRPILLSAQGRFTPIAPIDINVVIHIICPIHWEVNKLERGEVKGIWGENYLVCKACGCQLVMNVADIIMVIIGKDTYVTDLGLL